MSVMNSLNESLSRLWLCLAEVSPLAITERAICSALSLPTEGIWPKIETRSRTSTWPWLLVSSETNWRT